MKVLIVEDDKVLSLLLTKMAERMDLDVLDVCARGHEAVDKILSLKPELILMDVMLEDDLDGIDAVKTIRDQSIHTPVIFITGNSDPYNRERAKSTDYIDYLIKPISFEELQESVNSIQATEL